MLPLENNPSIRLYRELIYLPDVYKFWGYDSWSTTSFAISLFACSAITAEWKVESEGGRAEAVVNFSSIRYIKQGFEIDIKSIKINKYKRKNMRV